MPRGSVIARIIGSNAQKLQHFATTVKMWVYEEVVNGRKLSEIINTDHENVKYLPGYKLPENVVSLNGAWAGRGCKNSYKLRKSLVVMVSVL